MARVTPASLGVFAAVMALQFVIVLLFFPKTKAASLEETQRKLAIA